MAAPADPEGGDMFNRLLASMTELPSIQDHWSANGKRLGNYDVHEFLGEGEFAEVFSCTAHSDEGATTQLAVKHVNKAKLHARSDVRRTLRRTRQLCKELAAMKLVGSDCGFVCALVDVLHTHDYVHIIMEVRAHRSPFPLSTLHQRAMGCTYSDSHVSRRVRWVAHMLGFTRVPPCL